MMIATIVAQGQVDRVSAFRRSLLHGHGPGTARPVNRLPAHPEFYQVGKGEQGVFHVQPYKGELLPLWRFATPEAALTSSRAIFDRYLGYKAAGDFVGMDMARKYLQMGFTRSRRYANHKGGRKFDKDTGAPLEAPGDPRKAESASIFREALERVKDDPDYLALKARHRERFGPGAGKSP